MPLDFQPVQDALGDLAEQHEAALAAQADQVADELAQARAERDLALSDDAADAAEIQRLKDRIAELQNAQPQPEPPQTTRFGFDISDLGTDKPIPEAKKYGDAKTLLQTSSCGVTRVFLQNGVLDASIWNNNERLQALKPGDIPHISFWNSPRDAAQRAGLRRFLEAAPLDKFPEVYFGIGHEIERNLYDTGNFNAALANWLMDNQLLADELSMHPHFEPDNLVKTFLFFTQDQDPALKDSWPKFYGGQDFGKLGIDLYHLQARLNRMSNGKPAGSYTPATYLFRHAIAMKETGLDVVIPEWGGTLANTDPTGVGRAAAIDEGAALCIEHGIKWASWWHAVGSKDPSGFFRNHKLDQVAGANSPEVASFRKLVRA